MDYRDHKVPQGSLDQLALLEIKETKDRKVQLVQRVHLDH